MSQSFVGFVGVIAGSLATIGTQGFLARLDRRHASRTSARLLFGDVLEARDILVASLREGEWVTRRDLAHVLRTWTEHREAIARAMGLRDFNTVAGALKAVEFIQLVRERNPSARDQGLEIARDRIRDTIPRCDEARLVLAKAACTWFERHVLVRPRIEDIRLIPIAPDQPE